jgi:hypothetical protein
MGVTRPEGSAGPGDTVGWVRTTLGATMANPCPHCGADNEAGTRRCRVCADLLDASVPEEPVIEAVAPADPFAVAAADLPDDASAEQIEQATARALRDERLRRRPGFLDRVFRGGRSDPPGG